MAEPGAVGEPGYSPLIELPDGSILNAPQIVNDTGQADKIVVLDAIAGSVRYRETDGEQGGRPVRYVSTDASDPAVAALENATSAPLLNHAPFVGGDGTDSARARLTAFVNPDSTFNTGPADVADVDAVDVEAAWSTSVPVSSSVLPTCGRSAAPWQ